MEIAAFLISSASFMTSDELVALTRAMAQARRHDDRLCLPRPAQ
jgi:hypothetical protein